MNDLQRCPFGCDPAPCDLCARPVDPSDHVSPAGVICGLLFLVCWVMALIGAMGL